MAMSGAFHTISNSKACPPPGGLDSADDFRLPPHAVRTSDAGAAAVLYPSSRSPYRSAVDGLFSSVALLARWAALGCDETSRRRSTTKGGQARQPTPRCFRQSVCSRVIKSGSYEAHGLGTVTFGRGLEIFPIFVSGQGEEITLPRPNYPPQRFTKQCVGGFHVVSLGRDPRSEPFV